MRVEAGQKTFHFAKVTRLGQRGEVYFTSDTLTNGTEYPEPAAPAYFLAGSNEGFFFTLQIGTLIEIEIDEANEHPVPRVTRCIFGASQEVPDDLQHPLGMIMGLVTRSGHKLIFNCDPTDQSFKLIHPSGTQTEIDLFGAQTTNVQGDLTEVFQAAANRTYAGARDDAMAAEVTRTYVKKVAEKYLDELVQEVLTAASLKILSGNWSLEASGAKVKVGAGKVGFGTTAAEVVDILSKTIDELSKLATQAAAIIVPTGVGPSGVPTNAAALTAVATAATTLKGLADSIKGGV